MAVKNISLNELSYSIMEFYRSKVLDTDEIDIRWLKYLVNTARAKLLKQKIDKDKFIDNHYIQRIAPSGEGIEMELVDSSAYSTIPSGSYMSRTTISIPATIERKGYNHCFTRIGPANRLGESFDIISYDHALVYGNGKFNNHTVVSYLIGDMIYLISKDKQMMNGIKYIDVWGVFQNPVEAALITDPTYTDDDDYPVNMNLAEDIKAIILKEQFGLSYTPPEDTDMINANLVNKNI